MALRAADAGR